MSVGDIFREEDVKAHAAINRGANRAAVDRQAEQAADETVDHPAHYNSHPAGIECITVVEHFDFVIGNIVKYAWRAGLKEGTTRLEDLKKCLWYAQRAVERELGH